MVHTVGIAGVNGNVGAPAAKTLVKAAEQGKIKLVVFHRDGSKPKDITGSDNVELRVLDFSDPEDKIETAVKGINVFASTIAVPAIQYEPKVVDVLARSPDLITYIPSTFSTTWDPKDYEDPHRGPLLKFAHQGWERAKGKGLNITSVYVGAFDNWFFQLGFMIPPIKENVVGMNKNQLKNRVPITTVQHLGDSIARLAIADPETIKNREYSVVTFWPSGQEIVDLYTKIHGRATQVNGFGQADRDKLNADTEGFGPGAVGYIEKWENASYSYGSDGKIVDKDHHGPDLEEVARSFL